MSVRAIRSQAPELRDALIDPICSKEDVVMAEPSGSKSKVEEMPKMTSLKA